MDSTEQDPTTYHVTAEIRIKQIPFLQIRCPHFDKAAGLPCGNVMMTAKEESNEAEQKARVTADIGAVLAFRGGGNVRMTCNKCGSVLHVKQSMIVQHSPAKQLSLVQ